MTARLSVASRGTPARAPTVASVVACDDDDDVGEGGYCARYGAPPKKNKRQTTKRLSTSTINDLLMHIILS
jgi:hypothetical protein